MPRYIAWSKKIRPWYGHTAIVIDADCKDDAVAHAKSVFSLLDLNYSHTIILIRSDDPFEGVNKNRIHHDIRTKRNA